MTWREELQEAVEHCPQDELPDLFGELARSEALLRLRFVEPHENGDQPSNGVEPLDNYLKADEVARRLSMSEKWVYRHETELGAVHISSGAVIFPERAIIRYLSSRRS